MEMGKTNHDLEVLSAKLAARRERALRLRREAERLVAEAKRLHAEREERRPRAGGLSRGGGNDPARCWRFAPVARKIVLLTLASEQDRWAPLPDGARS
jgi:hypothetical protein